jgi:cystathionine beta-lyase/cystathionine gamma-synthase
VSAAASQASASGCHPRIITWAETPSNPLLKVTDVTAVAAAVREAVSSSSSEAVVVVDSTWLTPALMRPLVECGADLVVHSSTKYLAGHSDLVGGAVVVRSSEQQQEEEEKEDGGGGRNGGGNSGDGGSDDSSDSVGDGAGTGAGASAARAVFEGVRQVQCVAGSQQAPFDCWLLLRGMRSLGARLRVSEWVRWVVGAGWG